MQKQVQDKEALDSYVSPSFSSYATNQLAGIAEQVGQVHYRAQNDDAFTPRQNDDSDFEFVAFREVEDEDEVFFDDTVFPLFNHDLMREHQRSGGSYSSSADDAAALRFAMGRLLIGGGEDHRRESGPAASPSSESSSEAEDLEGIPAGTYYVWTPNSPQATPSMCKKSSSTGSSPSKRWKLMDLLRRSNSSGKKSFVLMTAPWSPANKKGKEPANKKGKEQWSKGGVEVAGKPKAKGSSGDSEKTKASLLGHEALYLRNRELRKKRSTFLPYRQDLLGFCTSRLGKTYPSY